MEIDARLLKERHIGIRHAYILMVHAVDEQEVVWCNLHASHLHQSQEGQRELYHLIPLHPQGPVHTHVVAAGFQSHPSLCRQVLLSMPVGIDALHHLAGQSRILQSCH